jgi:hypothetical protein
MLLSVSRQDQEIRATTQTAFLEHQLPFVSFMERTAALTWLNQRRDARSDIRACGERGAGVRPDFNWNRQSAAMMGYRQDSQVDCSRSR